MTELQEKQLKQEIQHIFDSGANEIRVFEMVKNFINNRQGELNTLPIPVVVCSTWLFFYEGEKDKPQFKVQANTQWEAYQIAEETYGPQVEDMMYCMI